LTWVVGTTTLGAAAIFGDTAISLGRRTIKQFGVQKVHQLNQLVTAGFAGSIRIAFREIDELRDTAAQLGPRADAVTILDGWHQNAVATYANKSA
jgi:ATP-dependent protease HslVU (ClpYQ) peptidase subunit